MAVTPSTHSPGVFVLTKLRLFLVLSVAFTWWIASLLPHYQPIIRAGLRSRLDEARQRIPTIKVDWRRPIDDPRAAYNASKVAMIIEPRVMPHLVPQLLHMITVVPPDWRFLFVGSDKSVTMLGRSTSVKHQQIVGKLDLMVLPDPWDISSKELVYRTLTDMRFYDEFLPGVEWLLKFEYDSILCANSEVSLNEWLDWHWAGAPRQVADHFSGNGGLSLRRVSAIRKVLAFQARYNDTEPEDEWFGKRLYIMPGLKVASGMDGALAVENVYMERPMGFHVQGMGENLPAEVWDDYERRKNILEYCPELYTVLDAKFERERCPGDALDGVIHPTPEEQEQEAWRQQQEAEERRKAQEEALKKLQEERKKDEEEKKKEQEMEEEEDRKMKEDQKKKDAEEAKKKGPDKSVPAAETAPGSPEASESEGSSFEKAITPSEGGAAGPAAHDANQPVAASDGKPDGAEAPASPQEDVPVWPAGSQPVAASDGKPHQNIPVGPVVNQPVAASDGQPKIPPGLDGDV
ncbi:hypothetical protein VPNG_03881 [Cytospora leucostoma]|uniref:DUF5672 domain-containing protein n=1 Tax=Cytospora leucostoma TaxID=1230097 RepID=A0A423XEH0_9PEZI|nr:hypothetical protein VPNG_03881 [Cytospora leucostoma]